jgi:hypothetical protein
MKVKDYDSHTFARTVRGTLYQHDPSHVSYALFLLAEKAPDNCVIIASTVKLANYFEIVEPHPSCKATHSDVQPVWWTAISARAFPDVDTDHVRVVRLIGEKNRTVRVPIMEPLTVSWKETDDYVHGMAGVR